MAKAMDRKKAELLGTNDMQSDSYRMNYHYVFKPFLYNNYLFLKAQRFISLGFRVVGHVVKDTR